jgi:phosphotransacetylase
MALQTTFEKKNIVAGECTVNKSPTQEETVEDKQMAVTDVRNRLEDTPIGI